MSEMTLEEKKALLAAQGPVFKKMEAGKEEEAKAASSAIAMLQRRVRDMYVDIALPGGDVFKVRTTLSREETQRIENIRREQAELGKADTADPEVQQKMTDLYLDIIGIISSDRALSGDWLKSNPEAFSMEDIFWINAGYEEQRIWQVKSRQKRIEDAISFRPNATRPE